MVTLSKPWIGDEERASVLRVLDSGRLVQGPETEALEADWASVCGARFAVATSSGASALDVALAAHGIGPGDEVITTPFTFIATVNTILRAGATPVFVDIEEDTFNLDMALVTAALTPRTRAIMPVHLFGQTCDMDALEALAASHSLVVIEDAAQAFGARFHERPVGSRHTACFSLYATKNVMSAEGGMVTTNDASLARTLRMLRSHGRDGKGPAERAGFNARMSELHAALARAQLARLPEIVRRRRANARWLTAHLPNGLAAPTERPGRDHVWHQYTVRVAGPPGTRDRLATHLRVAGIETGIFYGLPAHEHRFVQNRAVTVGSLAVAERAAKDVLSLPVHPLLEADDLMKIRDALERFVA